MREGVMAARLVMTVAVCLCVLSCTSPRSTRRVTYSDTSPTPVRTQTAAPPAPSPAQPAAAVSYSGYTPGTAIGESGDGFALRVSGPDIMEVNTPFASEIVLVARRDLEDVVIEQSIPDGLDYLGSQPSASERGGVLYWRVNSLRNGQSARIVVQIARVPLQAINVCATATVVARNCYSGRVTQPRISIRKTGPAQGIVGETVQYTVTVQNEGDAVARNRRGHRLRARRVAPRQRQCQAREQPWRYCPGPTEELDDSSAGDAAWPRVQPRGRADGDAGEGEAEACTERPCSLSC